ncbi:MAG: HAD-IIIA family hydrolase [Flavobacteriia bacterium]|nr:HAD-IIIA family hydrolase [Flavobacteriia bacterium]
MKNWNIDSSWTLFLDRDGVINHRIMDGYVKNIDEFNFLDGVLEAFEKFSNLFTHVFIITNQQGIAKSLMTESNLLDIHRYMTKEIQKANGKITKCYYAPELKSDKNSTRKPKPDLALKAKKEHDSIDFTKSIMIGDSDSDILFGKNLGMKTVRIKTIEPIGVVADYTCNSLKEFADLLLKKL